MGQTLKSAIEEEGVLTDEVNHWVNKSICEKFKWIKAKIIITEAITSR